MSIIFITMNKLPVPTGNPWQPSEQDPATVPVPLAVILVRIEGPYTERDRKLWTFLLHTVWSELEVKPVHELPVAKINRLFRECGGQHETNWIWESAGRLTRTIAEWERTEGDKRYQGIASLFQAEISTDAHISGILRFAFPALLIPILKDPRRFARLRVHFLIGISGKYAVTLYELLESVANKDDPGLEVSINTLRQWLKVPAGKLSTWDNFNRCALKPAINQINGNCVGAGFSVRMEPIKHGRSVERVRFIVTKVKTRLEFEEQIREAEKSTLAPSPTPLSNTIYLSTIDYEDAKRSAPTYDVYELERQWREWIADKPPPEKPGRAFVAFCAKKYIRRPNP